MRIRNGLIITLVALLSSSIFAAQIYKTTDKNGNVIFTDSPPEGQQAETVKLKPMTTISPPPAKPLPSAPQPKEGDAEKFSYNSVQILTPEPGETIRNTPVFEVIAAVDPDMLPKHSAILLIDGKPYGKRQKSLQFVLSEVDRGTHTLEVQIVDDSGKKQAGDSIEVYVHRTSQNNNAARPSAPSN